MNSILVNTRTITEFYQVKTFFKALYSATTNLGLNMRAE